LNISFAEPEYKEPEYKESSLCESNSQSEPETPQIEIASKTNFEGVQTNIKLNESQCRRAESGALSIKVEDCEIPEENQSYSRSLKVSLHLLDPEEMQIINESFTALNPPPISD
jgi:hypothetical protein